jgi:hypothetical protein
VILAGVSSVTAIAKFNGPKRRRRFDEEADWLPSKNIPFVMKRQQREETESKPPLVPKTTKKTTDSEGLRRAYKADTGFYLDPAGTLHAAGTRGSFLGADWMENYKVYGPGLINKFGDMFGKLESGKVGLSDWINTGQSFPMEDTDKYKALDKYMTDNPGAVKNFSAHSKGASVVEKWMENHPEFTGHARLYGTPHIDVLGSERFKDFLNQARQDRHESYSTFWGPSWLGKAGETIENKEQDFLEWMTGFDKVKGMKEKNKLRIANDFDLVTALDGSAKVYEDPTWMNHLKQGGGHYYGNTAALFTGFDDTQKAATQPWNNVTPVSTDPIP